MLQDTCYCWYYIDIFFQAHTKNYVRETERERGMTETGRGNSVVWAKDIWLTTIDEKQKEKQNEWERNSEVE
jgi:hypothetical protein